MFTCCLTRPPAALILMVPEVSSEGSQRVSIKSSMSFADAVEVMHEVIGCTSILRKPTLAYKLSTAKQKDPTVNLRTQDDWGGLITDASLKIKAKKDLTVAIFVLPDNYMFSLRAKNKKNAAPKKKGKMTTIDLDNDDDEGEDDDDEGVAAGEKQALTELEAEYKKCARCGPSHLCKIDRSGTHVHLTFPQRRAWAVSLACGTNKVTKTTPPQSELFSMFHGKAKGVSPPAPAAYPPNPWYQQMPMAPLGFGMPGFPGYHPPAPPPAPPHHPMLSSDPPDDATAYPSVIDFIETLIAKSPQREGLRAVGDILDSLHFFDINEIQDLTSDELGSDKYGNILVGDAQYLLKQVKSEVKRLDKVARRARPQ
ncbi:hypothetical protein B0H11DRAFT_1887117 [Mycena galericulata]|nr:hypothetical protein B0H11DRAFT_1890877 [Mycena galericulata]KAJ7435311.1 hypothetical protein B0H11DRAFT_1887117 [Mycena galericulata]